MRNIWLGIALVPYFALAGVDFWMHERGRRVPRVEQWVHAGLALTMISSCAPSSAAIVGTIECQASSQTITAARPHPVSKAWT